MSDVHGAFLIRKSDASSKQENHVYTLSARAPGGGIKHYRIFRESRQYYIAPHRRFNLLSSLAEYYWKDSGKMELQLIEPVISGRNPFVFDKKNLILGDKIGAGYFGEVMSGKLNGDTHVAIKLLKEGRGSR